MKNVENIQIQGEKQRAIYYLVEKNEKWFFRSLYPFHPVEIQNRIAAVAKTFEIFVLKSTAFKTKNVSLYLKSFWHNGTVVRGPKLSWHKHRIVSST